MNFILKKIIICLFAVIFFATPFSAQADVQNAVLAGGCFWCLEHDLEDIDGVNSVKSGYSGGVSEYPTYENHEGHQESVLVEFNDEKISYEKLLKIYLKNVDPYDANGQFCDRGNSYKAVIFANNMQNDSANKAIEWASKELKVDKNKIKVQVKPLGKFWDAEDYHQDFAKRNQVKYNFYRYACRRDKVLNDVWGD